MDKKQAKDRRTSAPIAIPKAAQHDVKVSLRRLALVAFRLLFTDEGSICSLHKN
jgi:hypothetical protein